MSVTPVLLSSQIPSSSPVIDLAVVEVGGVPLVVCAGRDDAVWTWDLQRDLWQKRPLTYAFAEDPLAAGYPDAENELNSLAAAVSGGRVLLAAGGHEQGSALWDLESGELLRGAMYGEPYVGSIATVKGEGPQRFVTGTDAGVEVWGLSAEEPLVELPDSDIHGICTVAAAQINGRSLVVAGGSDVGVWDLARDGQLASFTRMTAASKRLLCPRSPIVRSWWRRRIRDRCMYGGCRRARAMSPSAIRSSVTKAASPPWPPPWSATGPLR
ncbi:hypothetical protein [Streptomyces sp. NPDC005525]|uniref:hypothetical protein n=1 Tax=Streptomyces sp. NPDC005525 TaxID=3364720 RepID=UPI00368ACA11